MEVCRRVGYAEQVAAGDGRESFIPLARPRLSHGVRRAGMKRSTRWIGAVAAAIVSIPSVFFVSWMYLHAMVEEQSRMGVRVSTDDGSLIIPAVGWPFSRP